MSTDNDFVLVKKRVKNIKRRNGNCGTNEDTLVKSVEKIGMKITDCLHELRAHHFYSEFHGNVMKCLKSLKLQHTPTVQKAGAEGVCEEAVTDVVCYGLGNFASCSIARYQLALLLALRADLNVPVENCSLYDPRFTEVEETYLQGTGMELITENEEGKRTVRRPTIFYMPHCDKPLYNNLLYVNWGLNLHNVVIIGNSFTSMVQSLPSRILEKEAAFIGQVLPYTEEVPVENCFRFSDIFNDTSIHFFPLEKLRCANPGCWENPVTPCYDTSNLGIILKC